MKNISSSLAASASNKSNKKISEQILQMRCQIHLQEIKSKVLEETIHSISLSKKELKKYTRSLNKQSTELKDQKRTIEIQKDSLVNKNKKLEEIRNSLEQKVIDRTEKLQNSQEKLELYGRVFDRNNESIIIADKDANIRTVNTAFVNLMGYSESEVIGKKPSIISSGRHDELFYQRMWKKLISTGHWEGEIWNKKKNGTAFPGRLSIDEIRNKQGEVINYVSIFIDISEQKTSEEKLVFQAQHDPLTKLARKRVV